MWFLCHQRLPMGAVLHWGLRALLETWVKAAGRMGHAVSCVSALPELQLPRCRPLGGHPTSRGPEVPLHNRDGGTNPSGYFRGKTRQCVKSL